MMNGRFGPFVYLTDGQATLDESLAQSEDFGSIVNKNNHNKAPFFEVTFSEPPPPSGKL
jgi:hypothetical protein